MGYECFDKGSVGTEANCMVFYVHLDVKHGLMHVSEKIKRLFVYLTPEGPGMF